MANNGPLFFFKKYLLYNNIITAENLKTIEKNISSDIENYIKDILNENEPEAKNIMKHIYDESKTSEENIIKKQSTTEYVFIDAINQALREEMDKNEKVYIFGEDVAGEKGGVFKATRDLTKLYGNKRCFNSQLAEASIVGVAIGMSIRGLKPVIEIQFGDYIWPAMMQIRNELSTMRYRSNNNFSCPFVIRTPVGGYIHGGLCHSQNIEAFFCHIPGLRILEPSTALQIYGLFKYIIHNDDPVIVLE